MNQKDFDLLKEELNCPVCESKEIDLFFEDIDCETVELEAVINDYFKSENSFICECTECNHIDDYMHFDDETYFEQRRRFHKFIQRQQLKELDKK